MYGRHGFGARVLALLLLVLVLAAGGLIWFDFLGLVEADRLFGPVRRLVGLQVIQPPSRVPTTAAPRAGAPGQGPRGRSSRSGRQLDKRERELKDTKTESWSPGSMLAEEGAGDPGA